MYWVARDLCWVFFRIFSRLEVTGRENIPKEGGVVLASNHASFADPPLVSVASPRMIYFFAKAELFQVPVLGWFIHNVNAFPVKREEHDVGAFRKAYQLLRSGQAVVLFPEGTRSKTGELGQAKPGAGMLAAKAGVPIVPIYIHNSGNFSQLGKLRMEIGSPIYPVKNSSRENYQELSETALTAIAELKNKMYNLPS